MTERPGKPKFDVKRLRLAALAAVSCALMDCQSARADLVPCTVYICYRANPLRVTSGSVSASTTDGEAVVQNSQDVEWSLTYQSSNLVPFRPLKVSSDFSLPVQNYETATATATLDVSSNGDPSVDVDAKSSNSNPYGLALGGATAEGVIDYQVSLVSHDPDDAPDGTLEKVTVSGVIFGQGLTGPESSGSWSSGSANIDITDSSDNLLFGYSAQGAFGTQPL